jgi:hypothetical protein
MLARARSGLLWFALSTPTAGCLVGAIPPAPAIVDLGGQPGLAPAASDLALAASDLAPAAPDLVVPTCVPPPPGILSWWPGDGNPRDTVGHRDAASAVSADYFAPAMVGQGFAISPMAHLQAPAAGLPIGDAPITIELWASVEDASGSDVLFVGYGDPTAPSGAYWFGTKGGFVSWSDGTSAFTADGNVGVPGFVGKGAFHHVAVTSGGLDVALFLDGSYKTAWPVASNTTAGGSFYIGGLPSGDPQSTWSGLVDEVTIYDRQLDPSEIQAIYAAGAGGKCK